MKLYTVTTEQLLQYLTAAVTASSVLRAGMVRGEDFFAIWIEKSPDSRFWRYYEKLIQSLAFLSISPNREDSKVLPSKDR